jgi:large subunit ribosomal protein L21
MLATVVAQEKGPKIQIFKYHPRKRYRRRAGHRQRYTRLRVDEIVM